MYLYFFPFLSFYLSVNYVLIVYQILMNKMYINVCEPRCNDKKFVVQVCSCLLR